MSLQKTTGYSEADHLPNEGFFRPNDYASSAIVSARTYQPPIFEKQGHRLYMNENLFGPSPACIDILRNITPEQLALYPYGGDDLLVRTIAESLSVEPSQVLVNQGAASVIQQLFQTLLEEGDTVLLPQPGWDYYRGVTETLGGRVGYYQLTEGDNLYDFDLDSIVGAIDQLRPKVIVVTSPNMPTGNMMDLADLKRLARYASHSIILLDEAYYGFTEGPHFSESELLADHPNIVIGRTFSKMYGLASARIGYALCNSGLAEMMKKAAPLFGISWLSQQVAAAALRDVDYYERMKQSTIAVRENFRKRVNEIEGMWAYPSEANFVLIRLTGWSAEAIMNHCRDNSYLIRDCKGYKLMSHLRISIGTQEHMDRVMSLLLEFVRSGRP